MKRQQILSLCLISILWQQQAQAEKIFSWQESVRLAAQNNPQLLAAQSSLAAAEATGKGSYSGYFPQVTGTLSYNYGSNPAAASEASKSYAASLSASQSLFAGFEDSARVDQSKAAREIAESDLMATKAQVSYDLKSAFMNLQHMQNLVQLMGDIIKRREYNLRLVQLRYENGGENKGSVLLSKAYLEQAKLERMQADNGASLAQVQLKKNLGLEISEESIKVSGEVPVSEPQEGLDLMSIALAVPEYIRATAQVESAKAILGLARSSFYPSLNLTGSTGRTGPEWFPEQNRWSLGLSLSIPLFSGGSDYYAHRSASEKYRAAEFQRMNASGTSLEKVKSAHSFFEESVQKLKVDQAFSQAAGIRQKIAREKYNNGLLSFDNWDIIENDLINRQKSLLQSQRVRVLSEASWEQAKGKGVFP